MAELEPGTNFVIDNRLIAAMYPNGLSVAPADDGEGYFVGYPQQCPEHGEEFVRVARCLTSADAILLAACVNHAKNCKHSSVSKL